MGTLRLKSASSPGLLSLVREFLPPEDVEAIYGKDEPALPMAPHQSARAAVLKEIEATLRPAKPLPTNAAHLGAEQPAADLDGGAQ